MCAVSTILDYFDTTGRPPNPWPPPPGPWPQPPDPLTFKPLERPWDREALDILRAALALLEKLDAKLGEPDCTDPRKAKVLEDIEERVRKLEEASPAPGGDGGGA